MYSKFLNIILTLVVVFSFSTMNKANAGLIIGDTNLDFTTVFHDSTGDWQYIGSFDLVGYKVTDTVTGTVTDHPAPQWKTYTNNIITYAKSYTGIEAANWIFGTGDYALSTHEWVQSYTGTGYTINHLAYYDTYQGSIITTTNESLKTDANGNNIYDQANDTSAFIQDRYRFNQISQAITAKYGQSLNYVFKKVAVPEPSTLVIFALALFMLPIRRLKLRSKRK